MSSPRQLNRRDILKFAGLTAAGVAASPFLSRLALAADVATQPTKRILFFNKSVTFEHTVIARSKTDPTRLALAEQILTDAGAKVGLEIVCSKDGTLFTPENIAKFDGFIFFTTGDLTQPSKLDQSPPMSPAGKELLLQSVKDGKGFMAIHAGSDTFHGPTTRYTELLRDINDKGQDNFDPYIQMLGGEFIIHGAQQNSTLKCVDRGFPGATSFDGAKFVEEWYSLKNFAPDLHVILLQDTTGMRGAMYQRGAYPETWARMHGKGRVFYSSMGHRDDVWSREGFVDLLVGAMNWTTGRADHDVAPNIHEVAPRADPTPFPTN